MTFVDHVLGMPDEQFTSQDRVNLCPLRVHPHWLSVSACLASSGSCFGFFGTRDPRACNEAVINFMVACEPPFPVL